MIESGCVSYPILEESFGGFVFVKNYRIGGRMQRAPLKSAGSSICRSMEA
jgi:hypothetical protein